MDSKQSESSLALEAINGIVEMHRAISFSMANILLEKREEAQVLRQNAGTLSDRIGELEKRIAELEKHIIQMEAFRDGLHKKLDQIRVVVRNHRAFSSQVKRLPTLRWHVMSLRDVLAEITGAY